MLTLWFWWSGASEGRQQHGLRRCLGQGWLNRGGPPRQCAIGDKPQRRRTQWLGKGIPTVQVGNSPILYVCILPFKSHHICIDYHTHNDCTKKIHAHFTHQLDHLTDAYMQYALEHSQPPLTPSPSMDPPLPGEGSSPYSIRIIGIFGELYLILVLAIITNKLWVESHIDTIFLNPQDLMAAEFLHKGSMHCSPINPTVGINLKTLELFHCTHLRCPQLSIHSFVKTLSNLHTVSFIRDYTHFVFLSAW